MLGRVSRRSSVEFALRHEKIFTDGSSDVSIVQLKRLEIELSNRGYKWQLLTNKFLGRRIASACLVTQHRNSFVCFKFKSINGKPLSFEYESIHIAAGD